MDKMQERPPYVRFESRPIEDRRATILAGHVVYKDVDFALVTPAGSKDVHEAIASEWLEKIRREVQNGRVPAAWANHFQAIYEAWKKDEEPPVNGTRLTHWPGLNKAQLEQLRNLRLLTIEDVAAMNEEAISRIGMGGRALKQRAQAFLDAATGPAKQAEQLAAMQVENEALKAKLNTALEAIAELQKSLPQPAKQSPAKTAVAM